MVAKGQKKTSQPLGPQVLNALTFLRPPHLLEDRYPYGYTVKPANGVFKKDTDRIPLKLAINKFTLWMQHMLFVMQWKSKKK